jgi:hypothetical protein
MYHLLLTASDCAFILQNVKKAKAIPLHAMEELGGEEV